MVAQFQAPHWKPLFRMKNPIRLLGSVTVFFSALAIASAAGIDGKWFAQFDTQVGVQKYTYEFKTSQDGKIVGKAQFERPSFESKDQQKGSVDLKDVKVAGAELTFTEPFGAPGGQGPEIAITYKGTIAGDEIKLVRNVGDFASEPLVAKRVVEKAEAPATKPAAK